MPERICDERSSARPDAVVSSRDADAVRGGASADILSGPLGALAVRNLRVRPRQARSIESVERLLSSAAAMMRDQRILETISVEKISAKAGVTPQAAYRYFKDADELVTTALRCVVVREHERSILMLSHRVLRDGTEMARAVVALVLEAGERLRRHPVHLQAGLLQEYRQCGYDASPLISELICRSADAADIRASLDVVRVSVALTATVAVATSTMKVLPSPERGLEDMLVTLFVGVLQSDGRAFDAFREMGVDFTAFRDEAG